jgi:sensor histidine kinase YesM
LVKIAKTKKENFVVGRWQFVPLLSKKKELAESYTYELLLPLTSKAHEWMKKNVFLVDGVISGSVVLHVYVGIMRCLFSFVIFSSFLKSARHKERPFMFVVFQTERERQQSII